MKHLILIDIELSNWKAQNVKVDFSDKSTTITGWCGSGKTAIYKAWCWLITGYCDAINPKNHELFDNGAEITPDTPTASVTATISIDGTEYKLQRTAKAGFNKGVKSASDTYKYFIDGIATKANDFDKFIADTIAPGKLPLYMTMGEAFANLAETDKDSARMILEDAAGEITASDMQGDYALIADDIIKFGYDKLEMRYRTEMRDLNNDIKAKDIAIGFKEENVARLKQTDFASIESEIGRNNERIAAIDAELLNDAEAIKAKIEERNKKIQELQGLKMRLNTAEMDFNAEHSKKIREVEMRIEDMKISEKARARRNAALKEAYERELANIHGVLAVLVDRHRLAIGVVDVTEALEIRVGVATEHEVNVLRAGQQLLVAHLVGTQPAKVRHADNDVTPLVVLQLCRHAVAHLDGVEIGHALTLGEVYQPFELWREAEEPDLQAVALDDDIGFDEALDTGAGEVVVGTHDGKFCHLEDACHVLQTEVELMVADGHGVVAHQVHQANLNVALEHGVEGRAL